MPPMLYHLSSDSDPEKQDCDLGLVIPFPRTAASWFHLTRLTMLQFVVRADQCDYFCRLKSRDGARASWIDAVCTNPTERSSSQNPQSLRMTQYRNQRFKSLTLSMRLSGRTIPGETGPVIRQVPCQMSPVQHRRWPQQQRAYSSPV